MPETLQKTQSTTKPHESDAFAWLSKFFSFVCFTLLFTMCLFCLSLLHLTSLIEVNDTLALSKNSTLLSENLSYFTPLDIDKFNKILSESYRNKEEAKTVDSLARLFIKQYVIKTNTIYRNPREMNMLWNGVVNRLSTGPVFAKFWDRAKHIFDGENIVSQEFPRQEAEIKNISKDGWNIYSVNFTTYKQTITSTVPIIDNWKATIQFRFFKNRVIMHPYLMNPLGFTVTKYNLSHVQSN
ncbi:MAG: type IV secretion system protein [Alphaproteobacteria bacterium]|nr:type IV secretion system protein [Alphaproteobacteria bacterium]